MENFQWETAEEINKNLAKRFETTGQISLLSLTKLSIALGCSNEIRELFTEVPYLSIEEVIRGNK